MRQSRDELLRHLEEQREFLRHSAEAFDRGVIAESKRLAGVIRTLVHDTGRTRSLLGQLEVKNRLRYLDTRARPPIPGAIVLSAGLVGVQMSFDDPKQTQFFAHLGDLSPERQGPPVAFDEWWTHELIRDTQGNSFARKDLVLGVAHLDGGVHVDPELEAAYAALTRANSHGWQLFDAGGTPLERSLVLPTVRQIAWELETTLDTSYGSLPA